MEISPFAGTEDHLIFEFGVPVGSQGSKDLCFEACGPKKHTT